jgi:putative zinc finger protein
MSWHVESELLARYARGEIDQARAFSIEAHLPSCSDCRERIASLVDGARVARLWEGIEETLDAPRRGPVETGLVRLGVPEHLARLLGATPALRLSWLLACAGALGFAVWAAARGDVGVLVFLALAPLLPLAGVAAAYGPDVDPTYEVGLASPMRSSRLLLVRAAAVLASTTALAGAAALALPGLDWTAAAWLLSSLALTLASLALATRVQPLVAFGSLAAAWSLVVLVDWRLDEDPLTVFRAGGQTVCAVVTMLAAVVIARHKDAFETRRET